MTTRSGTGTPNPRAGAPRTGAARPGAARSGPARSGAARREQLTAIAAALFARDGYHNVTVGDIAAAAGLSGPAIYRHFPGKQAILAEVVRAGFDEMDRVVAADLAGTTDPAQRLRMTYRDLASFVIRHPEFGVMWRREYRHLTPHDAAELAQRMARACEAAVAELRLLRPQLEAADAESMAWAALSVLGSISDHRVRLPRAAFEELLAGIAMDVVGTELGAGATDNWPHEPIGEDRKERILAAAARLFRDRGYHEVTLDEIGAAAGIAGPSVYSHFAGKAELLRTITERIGERLRRDVAESGAAEAAAAASAAAASAGGSGGSGAKHLAGNEAAADGGHLAGDRRAVGDVAAGARAGGAEGFAEGEAAAGGGRGSDGANAEHLAGDRRVVSDAVADPRAVGVERLAAGDAAAEASVPISLSSQSAALATLTDLATRYVTTVLTSRDLVAAYFTEGHNLPDRDRAETRRFQRAYTEHWAALLTLVRPGASAEEVRIRVLAAFAVVNDAVRTRRLLERPGVAGRLRALMLAVLLTPGSPSRDVNRR
ncbi:TetR family transcriptional regulator [Catenulispora pinistramenti]|uniref:TetR family transcriptional regulator n=1 Tax=Catenulispora pinistramenti TaxID=2705254 RepID=UPI001E5C0197|nr:TetR family transcriptional regulator [Catenulispora pinistramenti]